MDLTGQALLPEQHFRQYYDRFYKSVLDHVLALVGSLDDAQEIMEDVFLDLWKRKDAFGYQFSFHQ